MIVDLLRNDLSRVAEVGSVQVPALFEVQALPTVWQMSSTITAHSRPGLSLSEVFAALFPCGSVTGAPKRQAMHHIARLERGPRGVYCGAVGVMAPGGQVTFNVPIRTVCVHTPPPPAPWSVHCGIGSGITLDATAEGEAAEWRAKQAFLRRAAQPFELIESLRLDQGHVPRLAGHLARLSNSARHFSWPWDGDVQARIVQALQEVARTHAQGVFKLRLLLDARGEFSLQASPLRGPGQEPGQAAAEQLAAGTTDINAALARSLQGPMPEVALAASPMPEADDFIRHKTTRREAYTPFAPASGLFDTLLYNSAGELTEFTIGNVAVKLDGEWLTPPLHGGLLPGVMRASLLVHGLIKERTLHLQDLDRAQGMALMNSVRGWIPVLLRQNNEGIKAA